MIPRITALLFAMVLVTLAGCATKHIVVLVADRDGSVGKAEIAAEGSKQLLSAHGDMTIVRWRLSPPSAAVEANPLYVTNVFRQALAAEPPPSEKFTLLYETGTTTFTEESRAVFQQIIDTSTRRRIVSISISGHSDRAGSAIVNDRLARERAESVRSLLEQQMIRPPVMSVTSHGGGNPTVRAAAGIAEPRNRRVDVIIR